MTPARFLLLLIASSAMLVASPEQSSAGHYSPYSYHSRYGYYYSRYYYKPRASHRGYRYHYAIHYPSRPRHVYYYNAYKGLYWGRFDLEGKPGEQYSLLEGADRKGLLKEIPEAAFPKPAEMPRVPESEGDDRIEPPPTPPGFE